MCVCAAALMTNKSYFQSYCIMVKNIVQLLSEPPLTDEPDCTNLCCYMSVSNNPNLTLYFDIIQHLSYIIGQSRKEILNYSIV